MHKFYIFKKRIVYRLAPNKSQRVNLYIYQYTDINKLILIDGSQFWYFPIQYIDIYQTVLNCYSKALMLPGWNFEITSLIEPYIRHLIPRSNMILNL